LSLRGPVFIRKCSSHLPHLPQLFVSHQQHRPISILSSYNIHYLKYTILSHFYNAIPATFWRSIFSWVHNFPIWKTYICLVYLISFYNSIRYKIVLSTDESYNLCPNISKYLFDPTPHYAISAPPKLYFLQDNQIYIVQKIFNKNILVFVRCSNKTSRSLKETNMNQTLNFTPLNFVAEEHLWSSVLLYNYWWLILACLAGQTGFYNCLFNTRYKKI
jgi:hypothetical protein